MAEINLDTKENQNWIKEAKAPPLKRDALVDELSKFMPRHRAEVRADQLLAQQAKGS